MIRQKIHDAIVTVTSWGFGNEKMQAMNGGCKSVDEVRIAAAGIRSISDILQEGLYMRLITSRLAKYSVAKYYQA